MEKNEKSNLIKAEEYYTLIGRKNVEQIKKYLHPDVEFTSPLASLKGIEAVVEATNNFVKIVSSWTLRNKFSAGDYAMIVYDVEVPGISHCCPGASLLSFRDGLIVKIELFHDASRFKGMQA